MNECGFQVQTSKKRSSPSAAVWKMGIEWGLKQGVEWFKQRGVVVGIKMGPNPFIISPLNPFLERWVCVVIESFNFG